MVETTRRKDIMNKNEMLEHIRATSISLERGRLTKSTSKDELHEAVELCLECIEEILTGVITDE